MFDSSPMEKKIGYIDIDNTLADFTKAKVLGGNEHTPGFFENLEPISGAIEAVKKLSEHYDIYVLSTPSWSNPRSWGEKRIWVEKYFGDLLKKKLILSHNKALLRGAFLIDDNTWNGAKEFQGDFIHFATEKYPDWNSVLSHLIPLDNEEEDKKAIEIYNKLGYGKGLGALFSEEDLKNSKEGVTFSPKKNVHEQKTEIMEETKTENKSYGEKIEELKDLIRTSLELCDPYETPIVCRMKEDGNSYKKLEESIIDRVVKGGHSISEAILQIEKENNPNIIQD